MEEEVKIPNTVSDLSPSAKLIIGVALAVQALSVGVYLYRVVKPRLEIKKYNTQPRIKKPRKWRRILRRIAKRNLKTQQ